MNRIIMVTGALGFIGSHFAEECLARGDYVIGVDKIDVVSNVNLIDEFNKTKRFKFIKEDINNLTELYDCDYIVNFAAASDVGKSISSSKQFLHDNIYGVHNILEIIRSKQKEFRPIFIHISTDETYGDIINGSHTELDLLKPSNPYSATKASADMLILSWARTYGLRYNIVRPTNNYGIRQFPDKLIPKICKYIQLGRKIPLHNFGFPKRIWLNVKDCVNGILTIIDRGQLNEIYNISGNYELKNYEIVLKICEIMNKLDSHGNKFYMNIDYENLKNLGQIKFPEESSPTWIETLPTNMWEICNFGYSRPGQDIRYSLDDSKLRKLGWEPKCDLDKELPNIVEYYKNNFIF